SCGTPRFAFLRDAIKHIPCLRNGPQLAAGGAVHGATRPPRRERQTAIARSRASKSPEKRGPMCRSTTGVSRRALALDRGTNSNEEATESENRLPVSQPTADAGRERDPRDADVRG